MLPSTYLFLKSCRVTPEKREIDFIMLYGLVSWLVFLYVFCMSVGYACGVVCVDCAYEYVTIHACRDQRRCLGDFFYCSLLSS